MSALLDTLLDREAIAGALAVAQPAWLADARRAAADSLAREGLPSARTEAWKYTNLRALEQRRPVAGDVDAARRTIDPATLRLPAIEGPRLVFVNGAFRDDLSERNAESGLSIGTIANADAATLESWRAVLTETDGDVAAAFTRINTVLANDGPLICVADDARIKAPLHLVFVGTPGEREIAWNARALVSLGIGASLRVVEHHVGTGTGASTLGNVVSHYTLATRARLDLVQIQDAAADATLIRRSRFTIGDDATVCAHTLEIGAQLARHDIDVALDGRGARLVSRGVFALRARQHCDTHLDIRHIARDTASDIVWRGVADQRARGVFHGAITVVAGADGADASLSNKNLLLSANAEIDTQPVLEIHADEVKAAHGATVGHLDERALFYLRSRGLPPDAARRLLIAAFCNAAFAGLEPDALRAHVESMIASRLPRSENA
ncbi:MAG: Fe-S cluster assembly protein SufD [Rhodanobacteraceae bacterium]